MPDASPPESGSPIPWLLAPLATIAGLPFFALAAGGADAPALARLHT